MTTDAGAWVNDKLTYEPSAQVRLKALSFIMAEVDTMFYKYLNNDSDVK